MLESYDLPSPTKKKNKKNLLFAGRISREKGIIRLLEIFKKYSLKNKEATLRLILLHDDYNYWIEVKKLIKELVFAGFRVHYQINPSIVDIHKYYSLSDILCITSLSEGTPNVISDAFYMNLVVVSFNVGKISSLITDKQLLCDSEYEFNLALKYLHNDDNYSYFQRKYSALYAEKMSFNQFKRKIKV